MDPLQSFANDKFIRNIQVDTFDGFSNQSDNGQIFQLPSTGQKEPAQTPIEIPPKNIPGDKQAPAPELPPEIPPSTPPNTPPRTPSPPPELPPAIDSNQSNFLYPFESYNVETGNLFHAHCEIMNYKFDKLLNSPPELPPKCPNIK